MEFSTKVGRPETVKADAVVVGVHADGELTATAKALDTAAGGALKAAVKSGDMTGKRGSQLLLRGLEGVAAPRVLLVGLGGKDDFNEKAYADAVRAGVKAFGTAVKDVALAAADWKVKGRDVEWQARTLAIAARETAFRSDELKSKREPDGNGVDHVACCWAAATRPRSAGCTTAPRSPTAWKSRSGSATCRRTSARRPTSASRRARSRASGSSASRCSSPSSSKR